MTNNIVFSCRYVRGNARAATILSQAPADHILLQSPDSGPGRRMARAGRRRVESMPAAAAAAGFAKSALEKREKSSI
ncbi:hypothetical protein [Shinella pollutisoli]|uniref:Uncharacterized protein n=1 Tax=Shinella pollutisoli TaxID=2250594 RepID=A0ABV7DG99_9HYPH|nr:hypothetical protein [Shinella pollutisoli]